MADYSQFEPLATTTLADTLNRDQVMDIGIRPLWVGMKRVAGPAFTVRCGPGDNLMLHAAIYRAPQGSVLVVESADNNYAVAGGNVCSVAQRKGIQAFVIDGVIRDLTEIRNNRFPVFARGVIPIPGGKNAINTLNEAPVRCGGVLVNPNDIVVADEEGIVVVPSSRIAEVLKTAQERAKKDLSTTLDEWELAHRKKIDEILRSKGFTR